MGVFLIFFFVFGAFGWFVYGAYRFIAWNSGHLSPEFYRVTRAVSFGRYFTRIMPMVGVCFALLSLLMWRVTLGAYFPDRLALAAVVLLCILMSYLAGILNFLEWQFWRLVDGVAVTFDPDDGSMEVEWLGRKVLVTPRNVARLEVHEGEPLNRLVGGYGYFDAYLTDGQRVRLHQEFFHHDEFMKKHYHEVPRQVRQYRYVWKFSPDVISRVETA